MRRGPILLKRRLGSHELINSCDLGHDVSRTRDATEPDISVQRCLAMFGTRHMSLQQFVAVRC